MTTKVPPVVMETAAESTTLLNVEIPDIVAMPEELPTEPTVSVSRSLKVTAPLVWATKVSTSFRVVVPSKNAPAKLPVLINRRFEAMSAPEEDCVAPCCWFRSSVMHCPVASA